jgi:hypothetical protein
MKQPEAVFQISALAVSPICGQVLGGRRPCGVSTDDAAKTLRTLAYILTAWRKLHRHIVALGPGVPRSTDAQLL